MRFDIITIFPKIFDSYLQESILKRAKKKDLIEIKIHNLRDYTADKHKTVDDKPYGGGPGMAFKIEPIIKAICSILKNSNFQFPRLRQSSGRQAISKKKVKIILFSAGGKQFNNKIAAQLAKNYEQLILICGRYEGVDARAEKIIKNLKLKIENFSIGHYVLTGGELPAMVLIDSVSRQIPGVLGKTESLEEKRFGVGLPVYTRPEVFVFKDKKYRVPKVLLSGNHQKIKRWGEKHSKTNIPA